MLVSDLCQGKYLVTKKDFEEVQSQWQVFSEIPLKLSVSVAGGLIIATKEREMWHKDRDKNDISLWMFRFYVPDDEKPFYWFSGRKGEIGNLEIEYINAYLIKRIGEVKWKTLRN